VFFDTLGIKWWYEPEGFSLRFDYEEFATNWDMTEDELLAEGVPQTFKHLDGKEYSCLPDFYLPELNFWVEIKGPNPTREELERAFILSNTAYNAGVKKIDEAKTQTEEWAAFDDLMKQGVYIIYGDVPWPFPQKGNILGYGRILDSGSTFFANLALAGDVPVEPERMESEYRSLLMGELKLCWQECPLCLKIGIGRIGTPYCGSCHDQIATHIWDHLGRFRAMSEAGNQTTSDQFRLYMVERWLGERPPNPANVKAMELTKGLINPEFFASGHKSPKLQEAYNAARSARFEHGRSP
jgi:hypothetical protein